MTDSERATWLGVFLVGSIVPLVVIAILSVGGPSNVEEYRSLVGTNVLIWVLVTGSMLLILSWRVAFLGGRKR